MTPGRHGRRNGGPVDVLSTDEDGLAAARRLLARPDEAGLVRSGLLGATVPASLGGADLSNAVLAEIIADLSAVEARTGRLLADHAGILERIRAAARPTQAAHFLGRALAGWLFVRPVADNCMPLEADGPGYRLARPTALPPAGCLALPVRLPGGEEALCLIEPADLPEDRAESGPLAIGLDRVIVPDDSPASRNAVATANLFAAAFRLGETRGRLSGSAASAGIGEQALFRCQVEIEAAAALIERAGRMADLAQVDPAMAPGDQLARAVRMAGAKVEDAGLMVDRALNRRTGPRPDPHRPATFTYDPPGRP